MTEFGRLLACALLTFLLLVAELVLGHFSHCLTLMVVTNQTIYNFLSLVFALVANRVSLLKA